MSDQPPQEETGEAAVAEAPPETRHGVPVSRRFGQEVLHPTREQYVELVRTLCDEEGFAACTDLTCVDYLTHRGREVAEGVTAERFEVVVMLVAPDPPRRVRIRVQVPESDPELPSLYDVHPGVEAAEREVYDMFGVRFTDHPDLNRILMPEDWQGHPLRKDYPVGRIPVQFKGAPGPR